MYINNNYANGTKYLKRDAGVITYDVFIPIPSFFSSRPARKINQCYIHNYNYLPGATRREPSGEKASRRKNPSTFDSSQNIFPCFILKRNNEYIGWIIEISLLQSRLQWSKRCSVIKNVATVWKTQSRR